MPDFDFRFRESAHLSPFWVYLSQGGKQVSNQPLDSRQISRVFQEALTEGESPFRTPSYQVKPKVKTSGITLQVLNMLDYADAL